jgi:osmotically-inducible protein OsmY
MIRFIFGVLIGALIVAGAIWYFRAPPGKVTLEQEARDRIVSGAAEAGNAARSTLQSLGLTPESIKEELARTGKVIRNKSEAVGHALADVAADARITTDIKAKFLADPGLSALSISVNTTAGCVTLSGTASTLENISKAMSLAYETDGVTQVISTLQVK